MGLRKAVALLCVVQGVASLGCEEPPRGASPTAASSPVPTTAGASDSAASRDADATGPGGAEARDGGDDAALASAQPSADAGSSAPNVALPGAGEPPSDGVRCAASASESPVPLGTHPSRLRDLVEDRGGIYALGAHGWGERRSIYRVARDGSGIRVLAEFSSMRSEERLGLDAESLYVSQQIQGEHAGGEALLRVSRAGGALETVAPRFGFLAGVRDGFAYGVDVDRKAGTESVVRVSTKGGEAQVLYRRKLARVGYKGGPFRYLDASVGSEGVYLADSAEGSIVRVPLTGGDPETVLGNLVAPCCLHVGTSQIFYSARPWDEPTSVARATGRHEGAADLELWAIATDGSETIVLGRDARDRRRVMLLDAHNEIAASAPMPHIFQTHAVVDDDCVYYARVDPSHVSWFNAVRRPKP